MKRYYYTYFDVNYLVKGLALINSLARHESESYHFFVVCMDPITHSFLKQTSFPNVTAVNMADIEREDTQLLVAKRTRSFVEYYWSIKAAIALCLINKNPEIDSIFYLDADLYFYSSPNPLWEEIENQSVLMHEHRFSPEQATLLKYGKYNAGMLGFRTDPTGLEVLYWWRQRCLEWCHARLENGKFGDQLYLNELPYKFGRIGVPENIGVGVAPWNHIQYEFSNDLSGYGIVNSTKIVFYHFHSLAFVEPDIIIPSKHITNPLAEDLIRVCFLPYINDLYEIQRQLRSHAPEFKSGLFNSNILNKEHTFIARSTQAQRDYNSNVPQQKFPLDRNWDCYVSNQFKRKPEGKTQFNNELKATPEVQRTTQINMLNLGCGTRYHRDWVNLNYTSTGPDVIAHNLYNGIPFNDGLFEVVYHSHLLEHFPKKYAPLFLKECHRVLKPGGIMRIAIPDLEQIARSYIYYLEKSLQGDLEAQNCYEWIMIELCDQMVRNKSGGEMLEFWKKNPMPAEDFVFKRVGPEIKRSILGFRNNSIINSKCENIDSKPEDSYQESDLQKLSQFRVSGEIHQWMYDRYSLSKLLSETGFFNIRQCHADESDIPNFRSYLLDTEENGMIRKPDSLFIEANRN